MKKLRRTVHLCYLTAVIALLMCLTGCYSGSVGVTEPALTTTEPSEPDLSALGFPELTAEEIELQKSVFAILDNVVPDTISGDKAASIIVPEDVWNTHISLDATPQELRTTDASQVRYIIRRYESKEIVGQYTSGNSITDMAYQLHYVIEIEDLKLNGVLDTREFLGGEPPAVQNKGDSPIGSEPDPEEINTWILNTINKGEFVDQQTVLVMVPEGWGTPYVTYRDYASITAKWKTKQLIPAGEWYSILLPVSASQVTVTTHPNSQGTDDYHASEEFSPSFQKPVWIIVENLGGQVNYYDFDPTVQNSSDTELSEGTGAG